MGQETLIFIDDQDKTNASIMAKGFADNDVKNRAYFNSIGASLISKYLISEKINAVDVSGIHSIKKVLEEIDVSDIILPNIRIDVRTVFDENAIFIPKSHFKYDILPDIYVVIKPDKDLSNVELLGFFEPSLINKDNANDKYYFIEKEELRSANDLVDYVKSFEGNKNSELSKEELESAEDVIMAFSDNDISKKDKKFVIGQLVKSRQFRDRFIEYENFEHLSYKALTDPMIDVPELPKDTNAVDEFEMFDAVETAQDTEIALNAEEETESSDDFADESNQVVDEVLENPDESVFDEGLAEESEDNTIEPLDEETISEENEATDENVPENLSETANLEGASEGFDAIDNVSDNMEGILFDNETVQAIENIDNTDKENTLSFDTVIVPEEQQENEQEIIEENSLSFDDVVVPETEILENVENTETDKTLSFDSVVVPEEEQKNEQEIIEENPLSFDDVVVPETEILENVENTETDKTLSFDSVVVSEEEQKNEQEIINENPLSFDDVVIPNEEISEQVENNEIIEKTDDNSYESDENEKQSNESFGKNLLENLSAESLDNIIIEGVDDDGSSQTAPDDLLSQIDDVLNNTPINTSSTEETNKLDLLYNESNQANTENEFEEISDYETPQQPIDSENPAYENTKKQPALNKKTLIASAVLVVVLLGLSTSVFIKQKNSTVSNNTSNQGTLLNQETTRTENINNAKETPAENILESNAPQEVNMEQAQQVDKSTTQEMKNYTESKPVSSGVSMSVSKIVWSAPSSVSSNTQMQAYLKSTGKSIKISLSTDLLLATEYAYTNLVKVNVTISPNGNLENASIASSSGSKEIDDIVLRSVNDTLKALKPPLNATNGQSVKLTLIIYF